MQAETPANTSLINVSIYNGRSGQNPLRVHNDADRNTAKTNLKFESIYTERICLEDKDAGRNTRKHKPKI